MCYGDEQYIQYSKNASLILDKCIYKPLPTRTLSKLDKSNKQEGH